MQDEIPSTPEPRHNADIPWSHLNAVMDSTPSSDQAFFIIDPPDQVVHTSPSQPPTQEFFGSNGRSILVSRTCSLDAPRQPHKDSSSADSIDPPRGDNPVGPPEESGLASNSSSPSSDQIQAIGKIGGKAKRRHSLSPEGGKKAALMRNVRSCWHCVFLKYSVSVSAIIITSDDCLYLLPNSAIKMPCAKDVARCVQLLYSIYFHLGATEQISLSWLRYFFPVCVPRPRINDYSSDLLQLFWLISIPPNTYVLSARNA